MKFSWKHETISWLKVVSAAIIIAFICRQFIFLPVSVQGESMEPSYQNANKLFVSKLSKIERFDVIVFKAPDADENYIKRVIGLPGDRVEMKNDQLFINGKEYTEPYLTKEKESLHGDSPLTEDFIMKKVPKGCLFVLGDNRRHSWDGRYFGYIQKESVLGEAKYRIYPFNEIGSPE